MTRARRTKAGGAKKRPTRYAADTTAPSEALASALRAHRHGDFASAASRYEAVLEREPRSVDAWMNFAAVNILVGRARAAARAYERALALAGNDARVQRDAGIGLIAVGSWAAARTCLERALALDPSLAGARLTLLRLCLDSGDPLAAGAHADAAVERAPYDPSSHLEQYRVLFDDRDLAPSIASARRALEIDPNDSVARFFLSAALAWVGEPEEAVTAALASGLRDLIDFVVAHRATDTRAFATKRETLLHALALANRSGTVLEFGVRHGISTRLLAEHVGRELHAFDSFRGLPDAWQSRGPGLFSTDGETPDLPAHVTLHVGWFHETLPAFARELREPIRLVHVDSDLYSSAVTVFDAIGPRLGSGCVIAFDEYIGNESWRDDEHRAFVEAAARFGWRYEFVAFSWITGQAVVRLT